MKYVETREQSAEILRMLLPLMAKHVAAFHPPNYTVWYEYVAAINPPLRAAIDALLSGGSMLDEERVHELFRSYISDRNDETEKQVQAAFQRLVFELSRSTEQAGTQAQQYGEVLERQSAQLHGHIDQASLVNIVTTLAAETQSMRGSVSGLREQLTAAVSEAAELRRAMQLLQTEALLDPLTGLLNRRGFDKAMSAILASDSHERGNTCLIMIDIDHFKRINDTHGHLFGDKVIQAVAQVLRANIKGQDAAARYGGEEFAVVLPGTPLAGATALAEKIRVIIEKGRVRRSDNSEALGNITVSLGVAQYQEGLSIADLVGFADHALYQSKHNGRNSVTAYAG